MSSSLFTAPAKQSVGETIDVLSGRLSSATLLEDRRAAILGLRSFAKDYPASVASGALRSLIGCLSKDGEDVDTLKVVLETLLMLFNPNPESPEASDEIVLWLADEFTQRQENITLLLDFLKAETNDFYSRLYSLQLLTAILAARTERTEECIFTAPLGISRLVAALSDRREAVRNEAVSLLISLTPTSHDIQKLVAFEDGFEKIFTIISAEGGLFEGDRVVEDCLILLANLLRLNPPNQSLFRETGGSVRHLAKLLESTYQLDKEGDEVAQYFQQQRNRNIYALLVIIRLFLIPGAVGTSENQKAFWRHGVLYHALQLAFSSAAELPIRAEALTTCADIISANSELQVGFAQLQVPSVLEVVPVTNGQNGHAKEAPPVYVIDGLLDLTLSMSSTQTFDLRLAACQCLKAYFFNHPEVRLHFLRRAIEGHKSGADETANVLTTLLQPSNSTQASDPYRYWFAAVIMFHLVFENAEAKALAMQVTEGDAENGEEVVTSIQTITAHLVTGLSRSVDERITVGYLMLLIGWLFEDLDGVNDFLSEGSNLQCLAQAAQNQLNSALVQGLCVMILGVLYEFSTKESPIPRATLHGHLKNWMTREKYIDALNKLRSHPLVRDFEVIPQKLGSSGNPPDVFFDQTFVEFFKDNYSRILRGIDRDPGMEISVVTNGVEKGVSRELVDSLRTQLDEKERDLQAADAVKVSLERQLDQEKADHRHTKEASEAEFARIKGVNEALQRNHEEEMKHCETRQKSREDAHQRELDAARREAQLAAQAIHAEHRDKEEELQRQLEYVKKTAEAETARVQRRNEAEMADLRATISRLEADLMKANRAKSQELEALRQDHAAKLASEVARVATEAAKAKKFEERVQELEKLVSQKEEAAQKARSEVNEKDEEKASVQTELDDLLMVFSDLEDKAQKYKDRLIALGESVSDGEDEEGEEEGDGDADEEGDGDVD